MTGKGAHDLRQTRFEVLWRKDILDCIGDMTEAYAELTRHLKSVLPKLSVDDFFFENDEEALRLEMSRNANNNATGDRGVEDRYQLHSLSTWDHLQ